MKARAPPPPRSRAAAEIPSRFLVVNDKPFEADDAVLPALYMSVFRSGDDDCDILKGKVEYDWLDRPIVYRSIGVALNR